MRRPRPVFVRLIRGGLLLAVLPLAGCDCESAPETAIMVEVDSDLPLGAMDRVRLAVDSVEADGALTNRLDVEYRLAAREEGDPGGAIEGTAEVRLPLRLAVLPRSAKDAAIHLSAGGVAPGRNEPGVTASARLSFVPERTLLLRLFLAEVCVGVVCPEGQTCAVVGGEGLCVDEEIDRPECSLEDLAAGRVQGCETECDAPADCDDGSECTSDGCSNGRCTHASACDGATPICCDGACAECCDDAACDDGVACTEDSCAAGACAHESVCTCDDALDCGGARCCVGACLECCSAADCDDGDTCTVDDCVDGACHHPTMDCSQPANVCTVRACVDGACTDVDACTPEQVCCEGACNTECCVDDDCGQGDCWSGVCLAGLCQRRARPEGTPCPRGVCQEATAECVQCLEAADCVPRACREAPACSPQHLCVGEPQPDGTACDEGGGSVCCDGACRTCCNDLDCVSANPCKVGICNFDRGCVEDNVPNGSDCGGGQTCTDGVCGA